MQISVTKIPLEKFDLNYLRGPDGKPGLHSGLDWSGLCFLRGVIFFWSGWVVLFFLVCKKIAFSTFPQQAMFSSLGGGEGGSII